MVHANINIIFHAASKYHTFYTVGLWHNIYFGLRLKYIKEKDKPRKCESLPTPHR